MRSITKLAIAGLAAIGMTGAAAADGGPGPRRAAPPPPTTFSWTGAYIGANLGAAWVDAGTAMISGADATTQAAIDACLAPFCHPRLSTNSETGVIGGLQVGYNWQMSNIVVGVEFDIQGASANSDRSFDNVNLAISPAGSREVYNANLHWFGTIRGRLGVLVAPNMLAYFTGGFAYGEVGRSYSYSVYTVATGASVAQSFGRSISVDTGWTIGGGLEWQLAPRVTLGAEYLYLSLDGGDSFRTSGLTGGCITFGNCNFRIRSDDFEAHIARVKVNFKL